MDFGHSDTDDTTPLSGGQPPDMLHAREPRATRRSDLGGGETRAVPYPEHQILITINKVPTFYIDIDLVENIDNIDFLAY